MNSFTKAGAVNSLTFNVKTRSKIITIEELITIEKIVSDFFIIILSKTILKNIL
jgi:hypothetical protein